MASTSTSTKDFLISSQTKDLEEPIELTLVHSAKSGNLEAFNQLVLNYQDVMFRTALGILGQEALAEDATQDAFISAYQHIGNFNYGSLKAWFMRILVNKCYDNIRRIKHHAAISLDESLNEDDENENLYSILRDDSPSIEEYIEASEVSMYIQKCLNKLPPIYRVTLALIDIDEMSYEEASTILRIPIGTVKSRLARARISLRNEIKKSENI